MQENGIPIFIAVIIAATIVGAFIIAGAVIGTVLTP